MNQRRSTEAEVELTRAKEEITDRRELLGRISVEKGKLERQLTEMRK